MTDHYSSIARFYDRLIGERDEIPIIRRLLRRHHPRAQSLLELACGTGAILEALSVDYAVCGLDASAPMLDIARSRMTHAELLEGDMCAFRLKRRFDAVICVFNSINHLPNFAAWKRLFKCAARHLEPGGLLLIDVNTERAIQEYVQAGSVVEELEGDIAVTSYLQAPHGSMDIEVRFFENFGDGRYQLHETCITERSYPTEKVEAELKALFSSVKIIDPERRRPGTRSEVLYFICRS